MRSGSGGKTERLEIRISPELLDSLTRLAGDLEVSRAELVGRGIELVLDDAPPPRDPEARGTAAEQRVCERVALQLGPARDGRWASVSSLSAALRASPLEVLAALAELERRGEVVGTTGPDGVEVYALSSAGASGAT